MPTEATSSQLYDADSSAQKVPKGEYKNFKLVGQAADILEAISRGLTKRQLLQLGIKNSTLHTYMFFLKGEGYIISEKEMGVKNYAATEEGRKELLRRGYKPSDEFSQVMEAVKNNEKNLEAYVSAYQKTLKLKRGGRSSREVKKKEDSSQGGSEGDHKERSQSNYAELSAEILYLADRDKGTNDIGKIVQDLGVTKGAYYWTLGKMEEEKLISKPPGKGGNNKNKPITISETGKIILDTYVPSKEFLEIILKYGLAEEDLENERQMILEEISSLDRNYLGLVENLTGAWLEYLFEKEEYSQNLNSQVKRGTRRSIGTRKETTKMPDDKIRTVYKPIPKEDQLKEIGEFLALRREKLEAQNPKVMARTQIIGNIETELELIEKTGRINDDVLAPLLRRLPAKDQKKYRDKILDAQQNYLKTLFETLEDKLESIRRTGSFDEDGMVKLISRLPEQYRERYLDKIFEAQDEYNMGNH